MLIRNNTVYLGGVPAKQLAGKFGTPLFVIEEDVLRSQYRLLSQHISYRPLAIHYACKANWNIQVMKVLHSEGARLDACSPGDVHLGLAAGYSPAEILYTGYAVSDDELRYIIEHGIQINADSLSQIVRYARLGGKGKIGIRVNTGVSAGFHAHVRSAVTTSKFGLHVEQLDDALDIAAENGLTVVGLHTHLGSDNLLYEPFLKALEVLLSLAERCESLEYIDLGGGIGVPFSQDDLPLDLATYGRLLTERLSTWCDTYHRKLVLRVEPGEYLTAEAGYLVTRVTDVKPSTVVGSQQTSTFVGTDTSFNHLFPAVIYSTYYRILIADRAEEPATQPVDICGNLMWAGDVLARGRDMPPLCEEDILVICNAGAYAACRASRFNGRPLPAEVMVKDGRAMLIRQRETLDSLLTAQMFS